MSKRVIERIIEKNSFERNVLIVEKYMKNKPETEEEKKEFANAYLTFYTLGHKYMRSRSKIDKAIYQEMWQFAKEHLPVDKNILVDKN